MDRTAYCRDGRRERQCFKDNGRGSTCCLPYGHGGKCCFSRYEYDEADTRRHLEASKEPKGDYLKIWANKRGN